MLNLNNASARLHTHNSGHNKIPFLK